MKKILILLLLPFTLLGQKQAVVHISTDAYPGETYWIIMKDSLYGDTIAEVQAGHYTAAGSSFTDTILIADSITNVCFLIRDSYGDGMLSPGSYHFTICEDTLVSVPVPSFTSGMYYNRTVPSCMPTGPPPGPCVPMMVNINLDQFQGETTWDIKDTMGNIMFSGGPYTNAPDYEPQFILVCVPLGVMNFTIYDSYGDGLNGALWQGNDGSYYVMQCGDTLVYGNVPNFGTDSTHVMISDTCAPPPPVLGCMDENYLEFEPAAVVSDSSCATLKIIGCTDSTMFNYDSIANAMDDIDSCMYLLTLLDHGGNGWVGSELKIYQDGDTTVHVMNNGFTQVDTIRLKAPKLVNATFFVNTQASQTASECGFLLTGPLGDTVMYVAPHSIIPFILYSGVTDCGNGCEPINVGCMDSLATNYNSAANVDTFCYYVPGCMSPAYLEYHIDTSNGVYVDFNVLDSCSIFVAFGCTDSTAFNYDSIANVDNGSCYAIVEGCMNPLAWNYNSLANVPDTCIANAYGCTDPLMFNYDSLANVDDSSCIPYIYGCMEDTMFNYNPLANVNDSCILYIYGCTDPSMFNFQTLANTEDFSCLPYIYGCTDSSAINYDYLANTDNNSCINVVIGCMDPSAYNFDPIANTVDSNSCLYDAGCNGDPGTPFWLNDPCYAWVIDVDAYCCENEWDEICQATYDYCEGTWIGPLPKRFDRKLIMITDVLGRPVNTYSKQLLFYIYDDGSVDKKYIK